MSRIRHFLSLAAFALATSSGIAADASQVIYPAGVSANSNPSAPSGGIGVTTIVGFFLLAGAGAWLLWRGRRLSFPARVARRLVLDETRSLGSRQFLVVASYEGKKFLLGVCPGRIDLLTPLEAASEKEKTA